MFCQFEADINNKPIVSLIIWSLSSKEDVFKTLNLSDDNEIFRGYTTIIELFNALSLYAFLLGQCIPWTKSTWTIGLGPVQVIVSWTKMVYSLDQY